MQVRPSFTHLHLQRLQCQKQSTTYHLRPAHQAETFAVWRVQKADSEKPWELACLCDFWPGGSNAVESQVEAVGHVLAIAKVIQEADVYQVVV